MLQLLLLTAAVRHRVPDAKNCFRGSPHLIPVFSFVFIQTPSNVCTPWQYCRIFSVGSFKPRTQYDTSSVIRACAEPRWALARDMLQQTRSQIYTRVCAVNALDRDEVHLRCADCWTCSTLRAPPHPANSGRDRVRAVSLRPVPFCFLCCFFPNFYSYVIETYQSHIWSCTKLSR